MPTTLVLIRVHYLGVGVELASWNSLRKKYKLGAARPDYIGSNQHSCLRDKWTPYRLEKRMALGTQPLR